MPTFDIIKEVKPKQTFRVASVIGKFDLQSEHIIEHFQGNIDNINIYSRKLSGAEINASYNCQTVSNTGLLGSNPQASL